MKTAKKFKYFVEYLGLDTSSTRKTSEIGGSVHKYVTDKRYEV